ncbi:hypothetical protein MTO96_023386 [Rhipicephalus appendiculatus]
MALPLTHCSFFNAPPLSVGTLKAASLQSDDGTELAKEASQSCSPQLSVSLPPTPTAAVTEKHTSRTDVTKVEELGMSTSSESFVSRSCSRRSAFPLCLPEFATSSGQADTGEAKPAEDFSVMSASDASEAEEEENDELSIVTDASSDVLPEALPSRVQSPEDSCSRDSGQSILEEGDVVLTEMTTVPFAHFTEPLEMPRDKCSESLLTAIEVALDQEVVGVQALGECDSNEKLNLHPAASGFDVEAAAAVATYVHVMDHQAAEKSQDTKAHSNEHQSSGSFNLPEMPNLDYTQTDSEQGAEHNVEADHEPQRSQEGTGMVVQATVRPVTAELDAEEGQVEKSLWGHAVCPSGVESSSPKPEDHLQAPDTPETPATAETEALGRSYVDFPAVDRPPMVDTGGDIRAALPEEEAPLCATVSSIFFVIPPFKQPPLQPAIGSDAEAGA